VAHSYNVDRVYEAQPERRMDRIEGRVETGMVDHSRRRRRLISSHYKLGKARAKKAFNLTPRLGGSYLSMASRSRSSR